MLTSESEYAERISREHATFAAVDDIHGALPDSAHHWSNRHVRPKLAALGVDSVEQLILSEITARARARQRDVVVLSLGSGNGDQELGWLRQLSELGVHNVRFRLLEFNPVMQRKARHLAAELGFADRTEFVLADFNSWRADCAHDVVIGFQALHHVLELEHLFGELRRSIAPDGVFVVHDMIGRNGHRRWPEALEVIERIWATLPEELRVNAITGRVDDRYRDIDCAADGFEGIRAQDVLPLLLEHFEPGFFLAYGNVIDPFVDRIYGGNFAMDRERDRSLIEQIGVLDDTLVDLGMVSPTRLTATFHPGEVPLRAYGRRTPERALRDVRRLDSADRVSFDPAAADPNEIVSGSAVVIGRMNGVDHDRWAGPAAEIPLLLTDAVESCELTTYVPDWLVQSGTSLRVCVDGVAVHTLDVGPGLGEHRVPIRADRGMRLRLSLEAAWSSVPSTVDAGSDTRRLSYVLAGIRFAQA